jgi:hypothetical protein
MQLYRHFWTSRAQTLPKSQIPAGKSAGPGARRVGPGDGWAEEKRFEFKV